MADFAQQTKTSEKRTTFPANLGEAQERNAALVGRANEIVANTARAVWESEMELFRLESEQVARALTPLKPGDDPAATVSAHWEQWQEGSEKLLDHMRGVNDLLRKCGWDLFHVYRESLREAAKSLRPRSP